VRLPADDLLSVWSARLLLDLWPVARGMLVWYSIKGAVLGLLLCEVGDMSEAGFSVSGWSDEFRKALPANVTVHRCLEFAGFGGIRSFALMLFIPTVWFWREWREALFSVASK
jgi:hypothetical protein